MKIKLLTTLLLTTTLLACNYEDTQTQNPFNNQSEAIQPSTTRQELTINGYWEFVADGISITGNSILTTYTSSRDSNGVTNGVLSQFIFTDTENPNTTIYIGVEPGVLNGQNGNPYMYSFSVEHSDDVYYVEPNTVEAHLQWTNTNHLMGYVTGPSISHVNLNQPDPQNRGGFQLIFEMDLLELPEPTHETIPDIENYACPSWTFTDGVKTISGNIIKVVDSQMTPGYTLMKFESSEPLQEDLAAVAHFEGDIVEGATGSWPVPIESLAVIDAKFPHSNQTTITAAWRITPNTPQLNISSWDNGLMTGTITNPSELPFEYFGVIKNDSNTTIGFVRENRSNYTLSFTAPHKNYSYAYGEICSTQQCDIFGKKTNRDTKQLECKYKCPSNGSFKVRCYDLPRENCPARETFGDNVRRKGCK